MKIQIFDMLYTNPDQVREFLTGMAKDGLVGGIYLWFNKSNGKTYVGSSINLYKRISGYLKGTKLHGIIGSALLKHGLDGFVLAIFFIPNATSSLVLALEQYVLDNCVCAYNILPTAGSPAGVKLSEEHKAKISASMKSRPSPFKGLNHTEESKAKNSDARKGLNHSGVKNPNFNKGKPVHLYVVYPHGLVLTSTHLNTYRLAEFLGIKQSTLYTRINNRTLFKINGVSYIASRDANLS